MSRTINWAFVQPVLTVRAPIHVVALKSPNQARRHTVTVAGSSCREGVLSQTQHSLRQALYGRNANYYSWSTNNARISLEHPSLKQPGQTYLSIAKYGCVNAEVARKIRSVSESRRLQLTQVADALVGNVCVLLNPDRYQGDWWQTFPDEFVDDRDRVRWYGADNTILYHPALVSLVLGLYRQACLLVRAGRASEILKIIPRQEVVQTLNDADPERALSNVKRLEDWIAINVPTGGYRSNTPIRRGELPKLLSLHKCIYTYGFEKTFGRSTKESWNLTQDPYAGCSTGIHRYMGSRRQVDGKTVSNQTRITGMAKGAEKRV